MIDNLNGADLATEHLIAHGHKQIAFLGGPDHPSINERKVGYEQAMERHHLTPQYIPTTDLNPINGEEAASKLLLQAPETTALFCANDLVAIGALKKFQGLGFKVPDDFSIVGFDDIYTVSYTSPPVTTIHVDRATMGQISAELLLGRIKYPERAVINTTIGIKLIERDSVCAPRLHTIGSASQRESLSEGA